jgi:Holliday junction resolvase
VTGRRSRNKGAAGERELAGILSDRLGYVVQRKLGQARDGGDDIQVAKYRIEVKRREALAIEKWCEQIEKCAGPGEIPVLAFRRNGQPWRCVVPLDWCIDQIRETLGSGQRDEQTGNAGDDSGDGKTLV